MEITLNGFGFARVQGSVYLTEDEDLTKLVAAMNALKALHWFPASVRDIRAFRVEQWFHGIYEGNELTRRRLVAERGK